MKAVGSPKALALLVGLALLSTACGGGDAPIAKVGSREIGRSRFEAYLAYRHLGKANGARREQLLQEYLEREALADAVERQGLLDPDQVQAELNELRKDLLINRYFERYLADKADRAAVGAYYQAHPERFQVRRVKVAHLLVRTAKGMGATERQAKLTKAREALARIRAGEPFEQVAARYSEDEHTASKGGLLGWVQAGSLHPDFTERVLAMQAGTVSEPFETVFGYHVVKVLAGPETVLRPLTEVEGVIRHELRARARDTERDRLRASVPIERTDSGE